MSQSGIGIFSSGNEVDVEKSDLFPPTVLRILTEAAVYRYPSRGVVGDRRGGTLERRAFERG